VAPREDAVKSARKIVAACRYSQERRGFFNDPASQSDADAVSGGQARTRFADDRRKWIFRMARRRLGGG
jgi:hypothetical protein